MRAEGMSPTRLLEILSIVPDPRVERTRAHKLVDIMVITLLAQINGAEGWDDIEDFGVAREAWLRAFLALPSGIPSADTFRRVFEAIDTRTFGQCLAELTAELAQDLTGQVVAIDGKTLRGSFDRRSGRKPLHMVGAWVASRGISLGQVITEEKSNEITAIPELLKIIDVRNAIVTIDAMGCQKKIAAAIIESGADYLLALKDNHPNLHTDVETAFASSAPTDDHKQPENVFTSEDKGHGRREFRRVAVRTTVERLSGFEDWSGLRSVVMVERERAVGEKTSREVSYYLSSLTASAETVSRAVRGHWSIENSLHWALDVTFREDDSRIRSRAGAANLAISRRLALSLLKLEQSMPGKSMRRKQKIAGYDPDYAFRVLATISRV